VKDGTGVQIGFEQAGQQRGIIDDLSSIPELSMFVKKALKVAKYGHKMKRIMPLASLAENGHLYISDSCRNKNEFRNECNALTMDDSHMFDDMVDACASAYILFNTQFNGASGHKSNIY
jgi:predicted phage terminase large subunit-like protein